MILELPDWMVERIVAILDDHPYTGAAEISAAIRQNVSE